MTEKIERAKMFVRKHKTTVAVTATALTGLYVHVKVIGRFNDIIEANDLTDLFYPTDEDEE